MYSSHHWSDGGHNLLTVGSTRDYHTFGGGFANNLNYDYKTTYDWGSLNCHLRDGWYNYYTGSDYDNSISGLFAAHTDEVAHGSYAGSCTSHLQRTIIFISCVITVYV